MPSTINNQSNFQFANLHLLFILLLPIFAVLFGRDIFAIHVASGRFIPFDIIAIVFAIYCLVTIRKFRLRVVSLLVIGSLFLFGLSGIVSLLYLLQFGQIPSPSRAFIDSARYILFGTVLLGLTVLLADSRYRSYYFWTLVGLFATVTLIGISQILAINGVSPFEQLFLWENIRGGGNRIAGTFRWQGPFVLFYGFMLPVIGALFAMDSDRRYQLMFMMLYVSGLGVLLFSGSRSALLILPLSYIPIVLSIKFDLKRAVAGIFAGFMIILIVFLHGSNTILRLVNQTTTLVTSPTEESRYLIWQSAVEFWFDTSILFGMGPRQLPDYIGLTSHNSYIDAFAGRGLLGGIILTILLGALLKIIFDMVRSSSHPHWILYVGFSMGILNLLIYNIAASGFSYRFSFIFLAIVLGMYESLHSKSSSTFSIGHSNRWI